MPECLKSNHATEVSLTVTNQTFDSAAAAVRGLVARDANRDKAIEVARRLAEVL